MAAAVKHWRILNSSSRTNTFNLKQILLLLFLLLQLFFPFFLSLFEFVSLALSVCVSVCLFVCLPISLCTLSAASCICHCQRGREGLQTRRSFEFCTISFTRFVVFSFRLLLLLLYLLPIHCPQSCCGRRRSRRQQRCPVRLQADS